eukprot:CAMPEP_0171913182 /NCGR_PEP_ID=MMETSP0993-20121228/11575_1 /TAXON_ID=483369 /ORGANISM="non described non described, Strain CCMP2098" /LENGTH=2101 /DNA_ID=CAMNT_0012547131 /DNA_START=37 /DNA_END=6342 /DNA_ORIENTATION=+
MPTPVVFLLSGEGAHSADTDVALLKCSPSWAAVETAVVSIFKNVESLETFLTSSLGVHTAPTSPVVTTVINILNADLWKSWGMVPDVVLGHSIGEVAAAYLAGIFTIAEAIKTAHQLGQAASTIDGMMLHTIMPKDAAAAFSHDELCVASINHEAPGDGLHVSVTLCGPKPAVEAWLNKDDAASVLKPAHPWHHRSYGGVGGAEFPSRSAAAGRVGSTACTFVSCSKAAVATGVDRAHWAVWLSQPLDFAAALRCTVAALGLSNNKAKCVTVLDLGAHTTMAGASASLAALVPPGVEVVYAATMRRGARAFDFIKEQRGVLRGKGVFAGVAVPGASLVLPGGFEVVRSAPFSDQGLTSQHHVLLAKALGRKFFPGLLPHELYRFTSIGDLEQNWDQAEAPSSTARSSELDDTQTRMAALEVVGLAFKLPPNVNSVADVWGALSRGDSAISAPPAGFKAPPAGYLKPAFGGDEARAAARVAGIKGAEATAMDPQHALALALATELFQNAGPEAEALVKANPSRIGVYIGAWQEQQDSANSAYRVLGNSLSALAARVANAHAITGPALTVNTACSSSLVAMDNALKDARNGTIDYAIVGGVNLVASSPGAARTFDDLGRAGMLSPTQRCHTLSDAADGYVRAEGGCLFLLQSSSAGEKASLLPCRARIVGAAVNQNSPRSPLTAVDPISQEKVIRAACANAGLSGPSELSAVEMHGTGTRLGDPVECSALASAMRGRAAATAAAAPCFLTAAKMNFGHLESAAGALGLLKAVLMLERRLVPGFQVSKPGLNPSVVAALGAAGDLGLPPPQGAPLSAGSFVGVSSFGFTGNNAHVVVGSAPEGRSLPVEATPCAAATAPAAPLKASTGAANAASNAAALKAKAVAAKEAAPSFQVPNARLGASGLCGSGAGAGAAASAGDDKATLAVLLEICLEVLGEPDAASEPDAKLSELGFDSLGLAELLSQIDLRFGSGVVNIDELMEASPREVAALLAAGPIAPPPAPKQQGAAKEAGKEEVGHAVGASFAVDGGAFDNNSDGEWIRTTHVGSLPRSMPDGSELSTAALVAKQVAVGVSCINDGESTRENYISEALGRMGGIGSGVGERSVAGCLCHMPCAADMLDVPLYATRFSGGNGIITLNPKRPAMNDVAVVSPPTYVAGGLEQLRDSLAPFLATIREAGRAPGSCFWSVPSPGTLAMFCENRCFDEGDHQGYVNAFAEAMRLEYEAIAATGLVLQVDCPDLAMGRHTRYSGLSTDAEFVATVATLNVRALNAALVNVPREQVRVHVCWGNYAGPHHKDLSADSIWPVVGQIQAKFILIEAANPRHIHEVGAFARAVQRGDFKPDQVIVPGVVDTTAARVEHPRAIAERLLAFVQAAGHPSRVMAGTDCGFASTAKSVAVTADIAWRKVGAMVAGARLATRLYLEASAPVPVKAPRFNPTVFRTCVVTTSSEPAEERAYAANVARGLGAVAAFVDFLDLEAPASSSEAAKLVFEAVRWAVDSPMALVGVGASGAAAAALAAKLLNGDGLVARRPIQVFTDLGSSDSSAETGSAASATKDILGTLVVDLGACRRDPSAVAAFVAARTAEGLGFDKRALVLGAREAKALLPPQDSPGLVVVVGAGLLGLMAAKRLKDAGHEVAVLEQRAVVGGIWSMYANATSQVNSSEGGYCMKEFLPDQFEGKHDNRDHSTSAEILTDLSALAASLQECVYTGVTVSRVLGAAGAYTLVATTAASPSPLVIPCRGVVMAINDRVGTARPLPRTGAEKFEAAGGFVCDGAADATAGLDWRGKNVVIFGMGAFAIENVRTALEGGAAKVTVVARRHGTICPKMIDYLNFVKPWTCVEGEFKHDVGTNVKQFGCWTKLYAASGATVPECWPKQVKHDGHTISVSDIWFVGHHLGKLTTRVGGFGHLEEGGVALNDGKAFLPADVVIGCIGFERSSFLAEGLTGRSELSHSNYLDKDMMYLADAEIDEGAFNSFYGSSVIEYGKFWTKVYVEGLERGAELGPKLWGSEVSYTPIKDRKWSQYIASAATLIKTDGALEKAAWDLVNKRTAHFNRTMPPKSFAEVNKREWQELHTRLNGGVAMPLEAQLPYFFDQAPAWCE